MIRRAPSMFFDCMAVVTARCRLPALLGQSPPWGGEAHVRPKVSRCAHQSAVLAAMGRDVVPFGSLPSKIASTIFGAS
jgi:hypothetical protein